jgi:CRISPR-associated protein Cas6
VALDLLFPVTGGPVPTDHLYPLYAALARLAPALHDPAAGVRFAPLTGAPAGCGQLALAAYSRLRVRVPDDAVRLALPLAGARLDVGGAAVRVGVPAVAAVVPAPTVAARVVTFKTVAREKIDAARFLEAARAKLAALGVEGEAAIPLIVDGPRAGEPRRRVVRVKGRAVVGYALVVSGLSAAHSLTLQAVGLGGRTRIGCGFFLPVRPEGV